MSPVHSTPNRAAGWRSAARTESGAAAVAFVLYGVFFGVFFLKSLVSGEYIAPSDSLDFGLAAFLSPQALWTDGMFAGYPVAADPQALMWYPVFRLIRALSLGWNLFMVLPYVVAGTTCFLFVKRLSGSAAAGGFAGLVYGFSGIMLAHISHFNQIHAASWLPLLAYGLLLTRQGHGRQGAAVASAALALMLLAGHPQVVVYGGYLLAAAVAYWTMTDADASGRRLLRLAWPAGAVCLGVGLAAILLVPASELAEFSRRAEGRWDVYISKALPPRQLLTFVFPLAFGGFRTGSASVEYVGESSPGEMNGYVGLLPLALALVAVVSPGRFRKEARFWLGAAGIALLLCLGDATPLAWLFYHAPGYANFRVPARHLFVVTFCLAVVAGLVFAEFAAKERRFRHISLAALSVLGISILAGAWSLWQRPDLRELLVRRSDYRLWAILLPGAVAALIALAGLLARVLGPTRPSTPLAVGLFLVGVHVCDMTCMHYVLPGYRLEYAEVPESRLTLRAPLAALRDELRQNGQRILAPDGSRNRFLLPNLTRAWGIPAASGTSPLGLGRYLDLLSMSGPGDVYPATLSAQHRGIDILAIRYVLVPQQWPILAEMEGDSTRWTRLESLKYREDEPDTHYVLFRNERALPHAWFVKGARQLDDSAVLAAVRTGRLPTGEAFEPSQLALVGPGAAPLLPGGTGPCGAVVGSELRERYRRFAVRTTSDCLLVVSDVFYGWWKASVDDDPARPWRVDHALIGVPVTAGVHVVQLRQWPSSVWLGSVITVICLLAWCGLLLRRERRDRTSGVGARGMVGW